MYYKNSPMDPADLAGFFPAYDPELHATIRGVYLGVYTRRRSTQIVLIWSLGNGQFLRINPQTRISAPERIYRISLQQEETR